TYVDRYRESVKFMSEIIAEWKLPIHAVLSDVATFLKKAERQWDYIFADPPYDFENIEEIVSIILNNQLLTPDGFFVLEHISKKNFTHIKGFTEARNYGQSVFSFFAPGS
ncbi:MAG TPA: RsmD family RNA methyltransferase, partial [Saprospiraceae bacterium]|nr:RsmD family RNA methyltransferase [Saprospiraceae bacterium]